MNATEWKKRAAEAAEREAVDLELPSGMRILARRPGPAALATWGKLPLGLAGAATGESGEPEISDEEIRQGFEFLRDLLVYCCVRPRISLDPKGENEIHPRDIPGPDAEFILAWAQRSGEVSALRNFRGQRADDGAGGDGQDVRPAAERVVGSKRSGAGAGD